MTVTNSGAGTNVHEISDGIYRINTPVVFENGAGFSFNQFLVKDDEPLLFHTGPRKMFTQGGSDLTPITEGDILGPSEAKV